MTPCAATFDLGARGGLVVVESGLCHRCFDVLDLLFPPSDLRLDLRDAVVPPTPIPNIGWFAMFTDPQRNLIGLFKERVPVK